MRIGTVRPEEAKVFDQDAGMHQFCNERGELYGGFEVFWHEAYLDDDADELIMPGWYWWACMPGCLPDGDPHGPFSSSSRAKADALGD